MRKRSANPPCERLRGHSTPFVNKHVWISLFPPLIHVLSAFPSVVCSVVFWPRGGVRWPRIARDHAWCVGAACMYAQYVCVRGTFVPKWLGELVCMPVAKLKHCDERLAQDLDIDRKG